MYLDEGFSSICMKGLQVSGLRVQQYLDGDFRSIWMEG